MRKIILAMAALMIVGVAAPALADKSSTYFPDYAEYKENGKKFLDSIEPVTGLVKLPNGTTLDLKDKFYFLNAVDARKVLTEAWGNPPDTTTTTAGMIFPAKQTPLNGSWGIELYPDAIGYVDDTDAATINYNELLSSMQSDTRDANPERIKAGYEPITLIGWAQPPKYDAENKRLYWAKEMKFGSSQANTLNYDIRFLNRHGVFVMSYIASMDQLAEVNASLPDVLNSVSFDQGFRYSDYVPGADKVAAVGVGGLIAGKLLAKAGFLVVLLAMAKKFGVVLFLPLIWLWRKIRGGAES